MGRCFYQKRIYRYFGGEFEILPKSERSGNIFMGYHVKPYPFDYKYVLAIEPRDGVDRPQMKVLEKYKYAKSYAE